ncbi:LysM domain-containing protein [Segatella copri]|uniref:LysM peptidoglycan-binding domain-containing protein n=1 Tax=Segatella copri TaxID=165179 RepID=UPI001F2F124C|nr:LysM domain-containing protein [Segatella copri]
MRQKMRYFLLLVGLLLSVSISAQTVKWRDIYTVKKKDTIFGIANKYGLSLPELMDANPEMKREGYMLQKGATLFIPYTKDQKNPNQVNGQKSGNGATVQQTATAPATSKAAVARNAVKVGVMLPLHNVDGDGKRMVEYYRGLLLACETLKQQGADIDVRAWNVPIDADIRNTLLQEGANQCDIIFGPLYTKQVAPLTNFCKTYGIKMVIPFSISGDDVERNKEIFQVYQSDEALNDATIKAFLSRFTNVHPIFVDCNDSTSRKGNFTFGLRKELERRKINYSITNVNSSVEQFAKAFMPSKQNVIILNTGRSPQLTQVLNKLDEFDAKYPGAAISLFGYTEWLMYAKYNLERFYKYDTYIPSTFYYNPNSAQTKALESRYERWFHQPMMVAQPRFAITGFDHGMYLIQGVKRYGKNFTGERQQMTYQPVQTPLRFEKTSRGGYKNKSFQLIHYTFNHQIEAVKY